MEDKMKKNMIIIILLIIVSFSLSAETMVYLGLNAADFIYSGICLNAEVLFGGPSITTQISTGNFKDYRTLNYEIGLKYYFQKYKGFNIQIAFPTDMFTYKTYSIINSASIALRIGWRQIIKIKDQYRGIALDANVGFGSTIEFSSIWPLAVAGIGYQF